MRERIGNMRIVRPALAAFSNDEIALDASAFTPTPSRRHAPRWSIAPTSPFPAAFRYHEKAPPRLGAHSDPSPEPFPTPPSHCDPPLPPASCFARSQHLQPFNLLLIAPDRVAGWGGAGRARRVQAGQAIAIEMAAGPGGGGEQLAADSREILDRVRPDGWGDRLPVPGAHRIGVRRPQNATFRAQT